MLRSGAETLSDLVIQGHERVYIACTKCIRTANYGLSGLIMSYGIDKGLPDLLAELSRNCPQRAAQGRERCGSDFWSDAR